MKTQCDFFITATSDALLVLLVHGSDTNLCTPKRIYNFSQIALYYYVLVRSSGTPRTKEVGGQFIARKGRGETQTPTTL